VPDQPLYSTANPGRKGKQKDADKSYVRGSGPCKISLSTKGRRGKAVTVIFNIPLEKEAAKTLMKDLQKALACGATLKGSTIELRGDYRDQLENLLKDRNLSCKRAGG
jgi:predicted translation initiation factor SUI1